MREEFTAADYAARDAFFQPFVFVKRQQDALAALRRQPLELIEVFVQPPRAVFSRPHTK